MDTKKTTKRWILQKNRQKGGFNPDAWVRKNLTKKQQRRGSLGCKKIIKTICDTAIISNFIMGGKQDKLKTGEPKKSESFVKQPHIPNPKIISGKGISIQTYNIHPIVSRYG
jgi:hypothetical protein